MKRPVFQPRRLKSLLTAGAAAIAIGALPTTADAASVSVTGGMVVYTTAADETNKVVVSPWGLALRIADAGTKGRKASAVPVTPGTGCWKVTASVAACSSNVTYLNADLGDGADTFDASLAATPATVAGGAGNDALYGSSAADTLDGGTGNDLFDARDATSDTLVCGDGTDSGDADASDTVAADCESIARRVVTPLPDTTDPGTDPTTDPGTGSDPGTDPGTGGDPSTGDDPTGTNDDPGSDPGSGNDDQDTTPAANAVPASIPAQTVGVTASGLARVRVVCPADSGGCSGTVALELPTASATKHRGKVSTIRGGTPFQLGRAKFKAAAGSAKVVPVRLSKRGRQRIVRSRGRKSRARVVVTSRRADGSTTVTTQDVQIRVKRQAPKRRARRR
jgi:hypothetical protein